MGHTASPFARSSLVGPGFGDHMNKSILALLLPSLLCEFCGRQSGNCEEGDPAPMIERSTRIRSG